MTKQVRHTWPEIIDGWIRVARIRTWLLMALAMVLVALLLAIVIFAAIPSTPTKLGIEGGLAALGGVTGLARRRIRRRRKPPPAPVQTGTKVADQS